MGLAVGLKYKAKVDVILGAVATIREGLASETIAKIIDPVVADSPGVTSRQSPWMTPDDRREGIRQPLRLRLVVVNDVKPGECRLVFGHIEIKLGHV